MLTNEIQALNCILSRFIVLGMATGLQANWITRYDYVSAIPWTSLGLYHTEECSLMLIFTFLNFLKPVSFLNIVFFIQISSGISFNGSRIGCSCLVRFRKQNRAWKNNNYIDFLFENVFKFYYKKNMISSIKLIRTVSTRNSITWKGQFGQCSVAE